MYLHLYAVCKICVFNIHFRMKIQVSSTKGEVEDLYPSFIAVSWHGPNYDLPLRQRVKGNEISRLQLVYFLQQQYTEIYNKLAL